MRTAALLAVGVLCLSACAEGSAPRETAQPRSPTHERRHAQEPTPEPPAPLPEPRGFSFRGEDLETWGNRLDDFEDGVVDQARRDLADLPREDLRAALALVFQEWLGGDADDFGAWQVVSAFAHRLVPDLLVLAQHEDEWARLQAIELLYLAVDDAMAGEAARAAVLRGLEDEHEDVISSVPQLFQDGMWTVPTPTWAAPRLAELVSSTRLETRMGSANLLSMVPELTPSQIELLVGLLADPDETMAEVGHDATVTIGAPALPALSALLASDSARTRANAAWALGDLSVSEQDRGGLLVPLLDDSATDVRAEAAYALRGLDAVVVTLVPRFVAMLRSEHASDRAPAACALARCGQLGADISMVLDELAAAAADVEDSDLRTFALDAVVYAGSRSEKTVRALLSGIEDDPREEAFQGLRKMDVELVLRTDPTATRALATLLEWPEWEIRREAARTLVAFVGERPELVTPLIAATRDENSNVRCWAYRALGEADHSVDRVLPVLRGGLSLTERDHVRRRSLDALGALGPAAAPALADIARMIADGSAGRDSHAAEAMTEALVAIDPSGVRSTPLLIAFIESDAVCGQEDAVEALRALPGTAASIAALIAKLSGEESRYGVADDVMDALAAHGEAATPAVLDALGHDDECVRRHLLEVVPRLPLSAERVRALLVGGLRDASPFVRATAAEQLGTLDELDASTLSALSTAMGDADVRVRVEAASALHRATGETGATLSVLTAALPTDHVGEAAWALSMMEEEARPALPALLAALGTDTEGMALWELVVSIEAVGDRSPSVAAALEKALVRELGRPVILSCVVVEDNHEPVVELVALLGEVGSVSSRPALEAASEFRVREIREAAQAALAKLPDADGP